jgi:hypothetical protein
MEEPVNHKNEPNFKEFVAKLARSDCHHDFHVTADTGTAINKGLVDDIAGDDFLTEHMTLYNVLLSVPDGAKATDIARNTALEDYLEGLPTDGVQGGIEVGYRTEYAAGNKITLHTYTGKKVMVNPAAIKGNALLQQCGIATPAYFVIDFSHHHFLEQLSEGDRVAGANPIHVITNQQTVNDAGPKTKFNDPIFSKQTGVPMISLVDVTNTPAVYTAWEPKNQDPSNFFMTKYTLEISPLKEVKNMLGKRKYTANMTVTNGAKKAETKDTKIKNSKEQILKTIQSLFATFKNNMNDNFRVNEGFQRKRIGDWGQALSCLTLSGRSYSVNGTQDPVPRNIPRGNTWYLTHDWIAAAYALLMGLNVILFAKDHANIFTNTAYGNIVVEEYMKEEIAAVADANLNKTALEEYNRKRNEAIITHQGLITSAITSLDAAAPTIEADVLKKQCLNVLLYAIQYQFFIQLSPDVTGLLESYPTQDDVSVYDVATIDGKENIRKAYETYKKSLAITKEYTGEFLPRLIKSIKMKDVYKSCEKWVYTKDTPTRLGILGGSAGRGAGEDKYAFLPYLSTMDTVTKDRIVTAFTSLLTKLERTGAAQLIRGPSLNRTYKHTHLTFKLLCEHVRLFLTEMAPGEPAKFNALTIEQLPRGAIDSNNHLHLDNVVAENSAANEEGPRKADDADNEAETAAAAIDPGDYAEGEEAIPAAGGGKQKGGFMNPGTDVAIVDSIKETTWPLLSAHLGTPQDAIEAWTAIMSREIEAANEALVGGGIRGNTSCLPIYIVLEGVRDALGELRWHPDYKYYVNYFLLLESMSDAMTNQDTSAKPILGAALQEILLTFITTQKGRDSIARLFEGLGEDYTLFPLLTTSIGYHICGSFIDYDEGKSEVLEAASSILQLPIVLSFIEECIQIFKTKSKEEFYIEVQDTFSECNYNLKEFLNRVNMLQEKIGKQIIGESISSIFALKRGTVKQKNKNRKALRNTLRKAKSRLVGPPRNTTQLEANLANAEAKYLEAVEENKEISAEIGVPSYEETVLPATRKKTGVHTLRDYAKAEPMGEFLYVRGRGGVRKTNRRHKSKKRSSYKHKTAKKH